MGIPKHPQHTTCKNPQANSIGNTQRALSNMKPPVGIEDANQSVDRAIAIAMYAMHWSNTIVLSFTLDEVAFDRDIFPCKQTLNCQRRKDNN